MIREFNFKNSCLSYPGQVKIQGLFKNLKKEVKLTFSKPTRVGNDIMLRFLLSLTTIEKQEVWGH